MNYKDSAKRYKAQKSFEKSTYIPFNKVSCPELNIVDERNDCFS